MGWSGDHSGFSLIEALIALLVLAIGLLGFVGLQVRGLNYNHDAYVRSMASLLVSDLIERMRLTRTNLPAGVAPADVFGGYLAAEADAAVCAPPAAGANQLARNQAETGCWRVRVENTLPDGRSSIVQTGGAGTATDVTDDVFTITLRWRDRSTTTDAENANVGYNAQSWEFQP